MPEALQTRTDTEPVFRWAKLSEFDQESDTYFHFYGKSPYLQSLLSGSGKDTKWYFPEVYMDGELIARGCFQELILYREDLDEMGRLFSSDSRLMLRVESLFKLLVHLGNGRKGIRILIAGNTQVSGPWGLFFRERVHPAMQAEIWKRICISAEQQFGPFAIVLAKEFNMRKQVPIIQELKSSNFRKVASLPVMMMSIEESWAGFDDYLAAMSAKYRIRAKAARKKAVKLRSESWDAKTIHAHLDHIDKLYQNVYARARFRLMRIDPVYFVKLKQNLGEAFIFQAYYSGDKLIGFRTSFTYSGQLDAHLIGLDYDANKEHSLYLNMLYDYVETAIALRCTTIDFGRTAMEIKSTVGAVPVEFQPLVKIRNTILSGLTCVLMENSSPEPWIQRHPFREES